MFCKNCGKEIRDGINFCNHCGAPQTTQQPASQTPPQSAQRPYTPVQPDAKPQWNIGLLIVGVILLTLGIVFVIAFWSTGDLRYYWKLFARAGLYSNFLLAVLQEAGVAIASVIVGIVLIRLSKRRK